MSGVELTSPQSTTHGIHHVTQHNTQSTPRNTTPGSTTPRNKIQHDPTRPNTTRNAITPSQTKSRQAIHETDYATTYTYRKTNTFMRSIGLDVCVFTLVSFSYLIGIYLLAQTYTCTPTTITLSLSLSFSHFASNPLPSQSFFSPSCSSSITASTNSNWSSAAILFLSPSFCSRFES